MPPAPKCNKSVILLPLLLAAAASHTPAIQSTRTAPKLPAACLAVTRADVELALGRSVSKPQQGDTAAESTCDYVADRARVTITLQRLDRDLDLPAEIAALQKEIEGSTVRPAPALGPSAFFLDIAGAGTQLHIIRGRDYILISVLGFGEAPQVSPAVQKLAQAFVR